MVYHSAMKQLAQQYIEWATERWNQTHQWVSADFTLAQFVVERKLSRRTHTRLFWHLVNMGAL
jgi:hypothetical protein